MQNPETISKEQLQLAPRLLDSFAFMSNTVYKIMHGLLTQPNLAVTM